MEDIRDQMMAACRWLVRKSYMAGDDGALSCRDDQGHILITPRGRVLDWLKPEELVMVDGNGHPMEGGSSPPLSLELHLAVYRHRQDARAVLLAQPPTATAFAVASIPLVQPVIPEMVLTIGAVPLAPYTTPFSHQTAEAIGQLLNEHDALLLKNRGLLVLGSAVGEVLEKTERIENMARALLGAKSLGHVNILSAADIKELMALRRELNLPGRNPWDPSPMEGTDA
jgi:L-fuculose-phosphate aldolase